MIFKNTKRFWLFTIVSTLLFLSYEFVDKQFCLQNISCNVSDLNSPSFQMTSPNESDHHILLSMLDQPYTYLDRGRQSFAFVSQDGLYVLKFFDLHRYKPHWTKLFPTSNPARIQRKMNRLFKGYELAYQRDRDHSLILYLQLSSPSTLKQLVVIHDRFGLTHVVDLGHVPFVLQRKATPTRKVLSSLLSVGNVDGAKRHLGLLIDMYMDEHQRGIFDRDHNFMYNTGFVEEIPMRLDVGRLRADERFKQPEVSRLDLEKVFYERAGGWLQRHFPQYREQIMQDLAFKLHAKF